MLGWDSGHRAIEGNEKADILARERTLSFLNGPKAASRISQAVAKKKKMGHGGTSQFVAIIPRAHIFSTRLCWHTHF